MRKKEKEITDRAIIDSIVERATVCRIGLSEDNLAYIVPLSFGYDGGVLYFHSAREGRKLDMIRRNSRVCFEIDVDTEVLRGDRACGWSMRYASVMGTGTAHVVEGAEEKHAGLQVIMEHYSNDDEFEFDEKATALTMVIRVDIDEITGKVSGLDL